MLAIQGSYQQVDTRSLLPSHLFPTFPQLSSSGPATSGRVFSLQNSLMLAIQASYQPVDTRSLLPSHLFPTFPQLSSFGPGTITLHLDSGYAELKTNRFHFGCCALGCSSENQTFWFSALHL